MFVFMNIIAAFHAYKFTHFTEQSSAKTKHPESQTVIERIKTLALGVSNPRPENNALPVEEYRTVVLKDNKTIECWDIPVEQHAKGTVILFHGYSSEKSSMLGQAAVFRSLGYSTLLVDFPGSGGSEGNQTTIGYMEAKQVKACFNYVKARGVDNIYLFGASLGAVAIMKAISDHGVHPDGIIMECPFGSMYKTVCARFDIMNVPTFPMAGLLVFWGGTLNGFWAFGHNPIDYAKQVTCPALLFYGAKDEKVSRQETDMIFDNLGGYKQNKVYPEAEHENYLAKYQDEWRQDVQQFLERE